PFREKAGLAGFGFIGRKLLGESTRELRIADQQRANPRLFLGGQFSTCVCKHFLDGRRLTESLPILRNHFFKDSVPVRLADHDSSSGIVSGHSIPPGSFRNRAFSDFSASRLRDFTASTEIR